jgi:hypothetical protein
VQIIFLQTADALVYKEMLDITSEGNILYCERQGIRYENYCGIKAGVAPWMATYNRIFMLNELVGRGYTGWVIFADADAFVADVNYDVRAYITANEDYCLIGASGGTTAPWNINAGVLFINVGDRNGREFISAWQRHFDLQVPGDYLNKRTAGWDEYPNDQDLTYDCIKADLNLMRKTKREEEKIFNYRDGTFIRQAIRAGFPDLRSRMKWIREEVGKTLGAAKTRQNDLALTVERHYEYDLSLNFGTNGNGKLFTQTGFAEPEPFGTWMVDEESVLIIPLPTIQPAGTCKVVVFLGPAMAPGLKDSQRVGFFIKDRCLGNAVIGRSEKLTFEFEWQDLDPTTPLELTIRHPDAFCPAEIQGTDDHRNLALWIYSIEMTTRLSSLWKIQSPD